MGRIELPIHHAGQGKPRLPPPIMVAVGLFLGLTSMGLLLSSPFSCPFEHNDPDIRRMAFAGRPQCPPQVPPIRPVLPFEIPEEYTNQSASRLSHAVKIPTVSYDDNGPVETDVKRQSHP